jgi:uncharacterized membrane protein YgaE (UPF0421/DUF939 family)
MAARLEALTSSLLPIVQCAIAASLAWFAAVRLVGHDQPYFAPIAAVISLGVSFGQRLRRSVELVLGVALGILIADLLIRLMGRGTWQIGVVVVLAMGAAVLVGGGPLLVNQGAVSAVLVVALATGAGGPTRFVDAVIGGGIGLLVNAVLLPVNPVSVARRAANRALSALASQLEELATVLEARDVREAKAALARVRHTDRSTREFRDATTAGEEIARIAPLRWRARHHVAMYGQAVSHIEYASRNVRVLARRAVAALRAGEPIPEGLPSALRQLAAAARMMREELARGREPVRARQIALEATRQATATIGEGGFSTDVIVAQVRSITHDLLRASGLPWDEVVELMAEPERPRHRQGTQL